MDTGNTKDEYIKVDDEEMLLLLKKIKFEFSTSKETYVKETLISNYINNLFNTLDNIEEYWNRAKKEAQEYIENFINVPLPKTTLTSLDNISSIKCIVSTNDTVKLYENENTGKVVSTLKNGESLNVLEYHNDNQYAKVKLKNGNIAYIDKNSISLV
ncbi:MAG: SH3 domain-containing protein [Bacilli bacterium]|nr:SH3 domain-containing protein [Bacilli bacterium]